MWVQWSAGITLEILVYHIRCRKEIFIDRVMSEVRSISCSALSYLNIVKCRECSALPVNLRNATTLATVAKRGVTLSSHAIISFWKKGWSSKTTDTLLYCWHRRLSLSLSCLTNSYHIQHSADLPVRTAACFLEEAFQSDKIILKISICLRFKPEVLSVMSCIMENDEYLCCFNLSLNQLID